MTAIPSACHGVLIDLEDSPIAGLGLRGACAAVAQLAVEKLGNGTLGLHTETGDDTVLVAIARPGAVGVAQIARSEYDGKHLLGLLLGASGG